MDQQVRVLVVDDSRVFRSILEKILSSIPDVQVVGGVGKGLDALEFLRMRTVDLVTLDVEMPDMNGMETLQKMIAEKASFKAMPDVLMISSLTRTGSDITLKALELGAFDFIAKPGANMQNAQEHLERMLRNAVNTWKTRQALGRARTAAPTVTGAAAPARAPASASYSLASQVPHTKPIMAIVLGVSTGGPKSLAEMLPKLCASTDLPILMVQHMPPNFTKSLADSLAVKCKHAVVEGEPGMVVKSRHVYIAPGGNHMTVRTRGADFVLDTNQDPPENGCRPSVDVLFRSAAKAYPNDSLVGIILTGMGNDGTPSLPEMKKKSAYLIAQDEESSVVYGMPRAAAATGLLDKVASLTNIPEAVLERINMVKR
ncbi:MAG: chemotaxis-specific protein-glutamate methyltransferase CheB [Acidobacteriota bacterium]|jgi:two-component system chemotaxis response regulator CheB|nr:chemotaxis-specific protein-glutamate methyltransferase CheB [Acidobacteriota bacterium]